MIVDNAKYESAINAPSNSVNIAAPDQAFTLAVAAPELGKSHIPSTSALQSMCSTEVLDEENEEKVQNLRGLVRDLEKMFGGVD
ncbi:hypothetical protein DCAR_0623703 [Daucus carota subsp. sativus]|uniref:Uncharacterized protein n=1 Tax=Daucus carota subsp. sativus TaxID=79200 RepID=A0A164VDC5_DAUCS|nr:hypothetical protein DCAR_0623703 [Daucus carota subsp. sativus]